MQIFKEFALRCGPAAAYLGPLRCFVGLGTRMSWKRVLPDAVDDAMTIMMMMVVLLC